MKKITLKKSIIEQLKNSNLYQVEQKALYVRKNYDNNKIIIYSYNTQIAIYNINENILQMTKWKYSVTTQKHKKAIARNFEYYQNAKIEILD